MEKYIPAIFAFCLGMLVVTIPFLAVLIVAVPLFGFAISYAVMVHKLSKIGRDTAIVELGGEPGFQTISGYIINRQAGVGRFFQH